MGELDRSAFLVGVFLFGVLCCQFVSYGGLSAAVDGLRAFAFSSGCWSSGTHRGTRATGYADGSVAQSAF